MMKFIFVLLALMPIVGFSAQRNDADTKFRLNQGYGADSSLGSHLIDRKEQVFHGQVDFAASYANQVSGSISLRGTNGQPGSIPAGAIVTDCIIDVLTAPLSGNTYFPKISFGTGATTQDLKLVTTTASYTVSEMACIPVGTAATALKLASAVVPVAYVATVSVVPTASITAGKIDVFIKYLVGN